MSTSEGKEFVVVGLGNPLMGDDGVGLCVLQRLERDWRFDDATQLVDGGTWGLRLLPTLEGAKGVILLDAIRTGQSAGTVVELQNDAIPRQLATKLSPHEVDLRELLAVMAFRGTLPPNVSAIGVEPEYVDLLDDLSAIVRARVPEIVRRAVDRLRSWGVACTPALESADACTR